MRGVRSPDPDRAPPTPGTNAPPPIGGLMRRLVLAATVAATAAVLLLPSGSSAAGAISSLSVDPSMVRDGATATGTVTLAFADAESTTVLLFSSDTSVATVPSQIVVPPGVETATFPITTNAAAPDTIVQITAWVGNTPRSANLSVNAARPAGPSLTAVSVIPKTLTGGSPATGTVTFTAATPEGANVQLSTSNPALVQVPSERVVNKGKASNAFPVTTKPVSANTTVTITAKWFDITRTTTITLTPGPPAAPDRVAIQTATWKRGLLTIKATSTNPNAILSVFIGGGFAFELTNNGGGQFSDQRGWVTNPQGIEVRSNLGGSATAVLTS